MTGEFGESLQLSTALTQRNQGFTTLSRELVREFERVAFPQLNQWVTTLSTLSSLQEAATLGACCSKGRSEGKNKPRQILQTPGPTSGLVEAWLADCSEIIQADYSERERNLLLYGSTHPHIEL